MYGEKHCCEFQSSYGFGAEDAIGLDTHSDDGVGVATEYHHVSPPKLLRAELAATAQKQGSSEVGLAPLEEPGSVNSTFHSVL